VAVPLSNPIRWKRYRSFRFSGSRTPCNLCGEGEVTIISRRDRWLQPLIYVMCRRCGLIFLRPMPNDDEVNDYYERHFWKRSQGAIEPTPKQIRRSMRDAESRLVNLAPLLKPGIRILDVGAGGGEFVALAERRGFRAEGVEPDVDYARYAQRTYGVKIHTGRLSQIGFGDRRFDIVTCSQALEHMRDPLGVLNRIHDLLAPEGHAFIWVPDLVEPNRWPLRTFHPGHLFQFTHETLVMMAAKAGLALPENHPHGTCLIFHRRPGPDPNWFRCPNHAQLLESLLSKRTVWRYFASPNTWARIPKRAAYWIGDHLLALMASFSGYLPDVSRCLSS